MIEHFPLVILILSLIGFWFSMLLGALLAKFVRPANDDERKDLDLVVGSSLTILGLIIGFTFSMAVSRYDMRKNYEEEEANAIGTEYVRVDLLPGDGGPKLRQLLSNYLDQRILFYKVTDEQQLNTIGAETTKLQDEMWSAAQGAAKEQPNPVTALAVGGMNDVLNRQGYTQAAFWNRIPTGAWILMISLAACCSMLVGYSARYRRTLKIPILPALVAIAFFLIADIDTPRRGVIHVRPQNLESLAQSLHGN
jgi:hypothetical protein